MLNPLNLTHNLTTQNTSFATCISLNLASVEVASSKKLRHLMDKALELISAWKSEKLCAIKIPFGREKTRKKSYDSAFTKGHQKQQQVNANEETSYNANEEKMEQRKSLSQLFSFRTFSCRRILASQQMGKRALCYSLHVSSSFCSVNAINYWWCAEAKRACCLPSDPCGP